MTRLHILIKISFLLILFTLPIKADAGEIDRIVLKGLDQCYHFNWEDGEKSFDRIIKKYPNDPRGYHYKSTIYLWYYLSTSDKADYENFITYSNLAIDKAELLLSKNPDDEDIQYLLGTNYSCRSIIFARAENFLDAIWASKESESLLNRIIEKNPGYHDAYLGLGLYNFAVDQIPSAFKWALNLAGISGDEATGLAYIKITAEKGTYSAVEAQYYLSQILTEVKMDYTAAGTYLKKLVSRYPENLLFNYSIGVLEIKKRNLHSAEKYISKVLKAKETKFVQLKAFSEFLMGDILFRENKYPQAAIQYRNFLQGAVDKDYTGIAALRLAVCYEMMNDRETALGFFKKCSTGNNDLEDDIFAKRKGEIYTERGMTTNEKDIVKYSNMIEAGRYEEASDSLSLMLENKLAEKIRAEVYLHLSEASYYSGKTDLSIEFALKSLELKNAGEEKWIHPFAAYYAARGYQKIGNHNDMMTYIDEAEDYENYDYRNKLEHLTESLKQNSSLKVIN